MRRPNFYYEKKVWKKGFALVAGLDEAGRGAFAGPVVAGCVVFPKCIVNTFKQLPKNIRIDDSKRLTRLQRLRSVKWIKDNALSWGVGVGSVAEINKKGIVKTTASAFRRAIVSVNKRLDIRIEYLLIDAFYIPYIRGIRMPLKHLRLRSKSGKKEIDVRKHFQQLAIIHGDQKSFSIAAASIIAKVRRDKLMEKLGEKENYKKYGWTANKGYGTMFHRKALKRYGATRLHRKAYIKTTLG